MSSLASLSSVTKWMSILVVTLVLLGATATPSHAWSWESTFVVKAQGTYSSPFYQALSCKSATLQVGGRTYAGSVSTNWLGWNACNVQFSGIPVRAGWAQIRVSGTALFRSVSGSTSVYIGGPNYIGGNTINAGSIPMN